MIKPLKEYLKRAFGYSGQKCSACSRVYIQKSIKNKFVERLVERTKNLSVDNPLESNTFIGPLINSKAYKNYQKYVKLAYRDGNILLGGSVKRDGDFKYGYYAEPIIIDGLAKNHRLFREELFVPILCIADYDKFDEAIKLCNDSEYGLTAGIYSNKKEEVDRFLDNIECGVVYVNRSYQCYDWSYGRMPVIWWLERIGYNRQRNWRAILSDTIYARAKPNHR